MGTFQSKGARTPTEIEHSQRAAERINADPDYTRPRSSNSNGAQPAYDWLDSIESDGKGASSVQVPLAQPVGSPDLSQLKDRISRLSHKRGETSQRSTNRRKKDKLSSFSSSASIITDVMCVGGEQVAKNKQALVEIGVTHVINCAGVVCPNYFEDTFTYMTLYLYDPPLGDMSYVFWDVIRFIDSVKELSGRVFIHCHQGVSRSCSMVICYLMHSKSLPYEAAYGQVKNIHGTCNPHNAYVAQLLSWQQRRKNKLQSCLYRIALQAPNHPALGAKLAGVSPSLDTSHLDPRTVFVLQTPAKVFIWVGLQAPEWYALAAEHWVDLIQAYEAASHTVEVLHQGTQNADCFSTDFYKVLGGYQEILNNPKYTKEEEEFANIAGRRGVANNLVRKQNTKQELYALRGTASKPTWEKIPMFDTDDLGDEGCYGLISIEQGDIHLYLWRGYSFKRNNKNSPFEEGVILLRQQKLDPKSVQVEVVEQGKEGQHFWDLFVNG